ncbi:hypothetical protein HK101_005624 [Irineochytrium annulatum]|nr:hypothetical protein HK101_005624 [Irineochytrium annulatum]
MSLDRFVKTAVVTEGSKETKLEEKKSFGAEIDAPQRIAEYDPRTLYERLKEVREAKEEEFAEKIKLGNLIKKLDQEEVGFLRERDAEMARKERERKEDMDAALNGFRQAREMASTVVAQPLLVVPVASTAPATASNSAHTNSATAKSNLSGIIVRKKRKPSDVEDGAKAIGDDPDAKRVKEKGQKKAGLDKPVQEKPALAKPMPKGLGLISGYGSGDDSD